MLSALHVLWLVHCVHKFVCDHPTGAKKKMLHVLVIWHLCMCLYISCCLTCCMCVHHLTAMVLAMHPCGAGHVPMWCWPCTRAVLAMYPCGAGHVPVRCWPCTRVVLAMHPCGAGHVPGYLVGVFSFAKVKAQIHITIYL